MVTRLYTFLYSCQLQIEPLSKWIALYLSTSFLLFVESDTFPFELDSLCHHLQNQSTITGYDNMVIDVLMILSLSL